VWLRARGRPPSLTEQAELGKVHASAVAKIGILAAVQLDGAVSLYAVPHPRALAAARGEDLEGGRPMYRELTEGEKACVAQLNNAVKLDAVLRLEMPDAAATCMDWVTGKKLAVGYSNGALTEERDRRVGISITEAQGTWQCGMCSTTCSTLRSLFVSKAAVKPAMASCWKALCLISSPSILCMRGRSRSLVRSHLPPPSDRPARLPHLRRRSGAHRVHELRHDVPYCRSEAAALSHVAQSGAR
jgi:hypothetical protein